jgi:hypothetical protein
LDGLAAPSTLRVVAEGEGRSAIEEARMQNFAGTMWKLIEASAFDDEGHELPPPFGKHPMGFAIFEAER